MLALSFILAMLTVLWLAQSVLLLRSGIAVRLRLDPTGLPRGMQRAGRMFTNVAMLLVLAVYPLARGPSPLTYYLALFPLDERPLECVHGVVLALLYLGLLYVAWIATDNLHVRPMRDSAALLRHVAALPLTAGLGAGAEELLFRGVLLA